MKIPLAAVLGCPIGHSRSPRLHGTWLKTYDLAGHYVPLHVAPEDLATALRTLPKLGFVGANVTIPHKEAALALADTATPAAQRIGAANTLTFKDGKIFADNTDGYGFVANLDQGFPNWRAQSGPALILGAGGAARAIVVALQDAGLRDIRITNRTAERADALAQEFGLQSVDWAARADDLAQVALLVNTTSLGMAGQAPLDLDLSGLNPSAVVTDIVYTPLMTPLLLAAQARGNPVVDGLGMLLHQAAPGFARWFGHQPEVTDDLRAAVLA